MMTITRDDVVEMVHKPQWFRDGKVFVSYAPTVGINKDGDELFVIDSDSGTRTDQIDDRIAIDVEKLIDELDTTDTSQWVDLPAISHEFPAVPTYYDHRPAREFAKLMDTPEMSGFTSKTLRELVADGTIVMMNGHGSPSADFRTGHIPYIKVSDIRAGQVNINPTNRVSEIVAKRFWKGEDSGLNPFDLVTPIRTSKNIGDFAVLMPGQEHVVLTKEVLILRSSSAAWFDNFYLLWALTLKAVRGQWDRIVFMQTNREDVGRRYGEIRIPVPPSREAADSCSRAFRNYYLGTQKLRDDFLTYLAADNKHHIYMSSMSEGPAEPPDQDLGDEV